MEIVIVGAGVFGAWTALSLARAGNKVTLLDQHGPGNRAASSAGESRIIRSAYGADEVYTAMAQRALHLWTGFFRESGHTGCFRKTGVLWMAPAGEENVLHARRVFDSLGIEYEWLNSTALANRFPQFKSPEDAVALWEPGAGALMADRAVQAVADAAVSAGVRREDGRVLQPHLREPGLEFVQIADGRKWRADVFVFACGSWLPKLFPELTGVIRPTRQELFYFDASRETAVRYESGMPIWIDETDSRIAYGFPDFGKGCKLGFHQLGPPVDPDAPRDAVRAEAIMEASRYLNNRIPALDLARVLSTEICHYENTPNGDFLIDRHPGAPNVWLLGGGSGHGFKHAPAVAEYMVGVLNRRTEQEPRFTLASQSAPRGRVL